MSSLLFDQDPHPRAGEGVVVPNELARELVTDMADAFSLAMDVKTLPPGRMIERAPVAAAFFAELRAVRRDRLEQEA